MSTPEALSWSTDGCPVAATLDVVGDRATFLVLREVFCGVRRFDDLRVRTSLSRAVLSARLASLVDDGLLRRHPYREPGSRERHEYRLTDVGFDLYPVLVAMADWGTRHRTGARGPSVEFVHGGCGHAVHAGVRCEDGHDVAQRRDVVGRPGPGARRLDAADHVVAAG